MVWKADTDVYMWQLQYMQAYTIAPVMPPLDAPIAATMSGNIKLSNDVALRIEDPAQMKINFGEGGAA